MNSYNELEYWSNREGLPNSDGAYYKNRRDSHLYFIKEKLFPGVTVLDFGSGDGRLLSAYDDFALLVFSYDISTNWREQCIEEGKKYSFRHIHFADSEFKNDLSSKLPKFDIVCTSLVLLHQRPSMIETVMSELYNIAKNYVIVISRFRLDKSIDTKDSKQTSYNHDYLDICHKNNWKFTEPMYKNNQIYFCYGKTIARKPQGLP